MKKRIKINIDDVKFKTYPTFSSCCKFTTSNAYTDVIQKMYDDGKVEINCRITPEYISVAYYNKEVIGAFFAFPGVLLSAFVKNEYRRNGIMKVMFKSYIKSNKRSHKEYIFTTCKDDKKIRKFLVIFGFKHTSSRWVSDIVCDNKCKGNFTEEYCNYNYNLG